MGLNPASVSALALGIVYHYPIIRPRAPNHARGRNTSSAGPHVPLALPSFVYAMYPVSDPP